MPLIDFDATLYAATHAVLGTAATLTLASLTAPASLSAIDLSAGVPVGDPNGVEVDTIKPAAKFRATALAAAGIAVADLAGGALAMNGTTWRIESARPLPGPGGEARGEVMVFLIQDDA